MAGSALRNYHYLVRRLVRRAAATINTALLLPLASCAALPSAADRPAVAAEQAAVERRLASVLPDADTMRVTVLQPGVRQLYAWLPAGPWALHALEIDEQICAPQISAAKPGPPLDSTALTSVLGARTLAAMNADFFYLPSGLPIGAHVRAGRVLVGPGFRPAYGIDAAGAHWQGTAIVVGTVASGEDVTSLVQVNRPVDGGPHQPPRDGVTYYDEWYGAATTADTSGGTLHLRRVTAGRAGGANAHAAGAGAGAGVVVGAARAGATVPLDTAHVALQARGAAASDWLARRAVGDTVHWQLNVVPAAEPTRAGIEVVGGFPLLIAGGRGVLAEQTGIIARFGPVRHPRTAVAWDEQARLLWWVIVDGRRPPYSDGMSLAELEWLLLRFGASHAINLDGGGSTALVVHGELVNLPTDEEGERLVGNALVLHGCAAATASSTLAGGATRR